MTIEIKPELTRQDKLNIALEIYRREIDKGTQYPANGYPDLAVIINEDGTITYGPPGSIPETIEIEKSNG